MDPNIIRAGEQLPAVGPVLAVDAPEAARRLGVSERLFQKLVASGRAPRGIKLGRRRVWPVAQLEAFLAAEAERQG